MGKLITVVTVCFNAEEEIKRTVCSILDQSFSDFEYVVVDGKSTDGTVGYMSGKRDDLENKGISFNLISEPDKGIYNAMNKGIDLASGEWVIFLNAGDVFYDSLTLEKVCSFLNEAPDADIVYGDVVLKKDNKYKIEKVDDLEKILYLMPFCHQSSFTRREVLKEFRFDEKYKICADHDLFARCFQNGRKFKYMSYPIAVYELFGKSSEDSSYGFWMERLMIQKEDGYISDEEFDRHVEELKQKTGRLRFRQRIKRFIPRFLVEKRQERMDRDEGWSLTYPDINEDRKQSI